MANAVASSSRERPARNRSSMHSLLQHDPHEGVVMTHEIIHRSRRDAARGGTLKIINQYEFRLKVGKGQHGEVYLAEDSTKGYMQVAVKCVRRKNKADRLSKLRRKNNIPRSPHTPLVDQLGSTEHKIRKEIAIMKKLNHPHVVRLLEVIDDPLTDKIYMVMEYLGGGEIKWRSPSDNPLLRVDQTRRICRDVILGLEYLHHQGIIHRDIKPANLLWTADRRTVKITDFGVSTFSYAQRLAAAGKGNIKDDDTDPILMDESDLSKTAGTPMFLAPEIVYEVPDEPQHGRSSSTLHIQTQLQEIRKRPPITKAIDIWAFGVTIYGLLFGILPFTAKTEWEIYQVIRTQDWNVPETMGLDQLPTGGRHQWKTGMRPGERIPPDTEGAQVIDLLDKLLQKNSNKRISLEQVKQHPWILRDLEKPEEWLRDTRLTRYLQLEPTHDETSSAMSSVRFRWLPRIGNRILSTLRSVKPQRSFRRPPPVDDAEKTGGVGVHSEPHMVNLVRHQTTTGQPAQRTHGSVREKQRRRSRQELLRNKSTNDIGAKPGKAFEPWAMWNNGSPATTAMAAAGPSKGKGVETALQVPPTQSSRFNSPLPSPVGSSQVTTPVGEYTPGQSPDSDRPRSMMMKWVSKLSGHRQSSYVSAYNMPMMDASPTALAHGRSHPIPATSPPSRDSVDALSGHVTSRQSSMSISGKLTKAMRAASWTGPDFARARPSEDMTSLYSGDRADELDEETLLYGAGGIAGSPVPSQPNSALLSTVSSAQSLGPPITAAHAIRSRADAAAAADLPDPSLPESSARSRHVPCQARLRTTSPLARVPFNPEDSADEDEDDETDYDSDNDSSSASPQSRRRVSGIIRNEDVDVDLDDLPPSSEGGSFDMQPSTSQRYRFDDESEDEDEVHLEVRTRRPSQSATEMSPPRRSLSAHRPLICT